MLEQLFLSIFIFFFCFSSPALSGLLPVAHVLVSYCKSTSPAFIFGSIYWVFEPA
jgi:hypothetical protein